MSNGHIRWGARVVVAVCVAGLLVGCGKPKQSSATQPSPAEETTLMREYSPNATTVKVTLDVGKIEMPEIIASGWINFVVTNEDKVAHTFAIRGEGVDQLLPGRIEPGKMQTMRIELRPGTYQVICPECAADTTAVTRQLVVAQW